MKFILGILCGLMVLFSGGCALIFLSGSGFNGMFESVPGALIPGSIAALNVLVLIALFGTARPKPWAFYTLAVLDAVAVAILALMWSEFGLKDGEINVIGSILIGGLALKAILTVAAVRRL